MSSLWNECTITGIPVEGAKGALGLYIWGNGSDGTRNVPKRALPPDVWHTIDLADVEGMRWDLALPTDTKAVVFSGMCGTSGATGVYVGLIQTFRPVGSTHTEYNIAAVSSVHGGAFRHNSSVVVPLRDRKFEFKWSCSEANAVALYQQFTIQTYLRGGDPLPPLTQPIPPPSNAAITASPSGAHLTVTVESGPGNASDWVGVYASNLAGSSWTDWMYLTGTKDVPAEGMADATFTITAPTAPGTYVLRFYANGGHTHLLATSSPFTVGGP